MDSRTRLGYKKEKRKDPQQPAKSPSSSLETCYCSFSHIAYIFSPLLVWGFQYGWLAIAPLLAKKKNFQVIMTIAFVHFFPESLFFLPWRSGYRGCIGCVFWISNSNCGFCVWVAPAGGVINIYTRLTNGRDELLRRRCRDRYEEKTLENVRGIHISSRERIDLVRDRIYFKERVTCSNEV